jgi:hypothetical protein
MTDKGYVLTIRPNAKCVHIYELHFQINDSKDILGCGHTKEQAWKNAALYVRAEEFIKDF